VCFEESCDLWSWSVEKVLSADVYRCSGYAVQISVKVFVLGV
jgi:hypothetical protein